MGEMRNVCSVLVGKPGVKRPLERHGNRWEDNTKIYMKLIGFEDLDRLRGGL
jgi:hypothetical protein